MLNHVDCPHSSCSRVEKFNLKGRIYGSMCDLSLTHLISKLCKIHRVIIMTGKTDS